MSKLAIYAIHPIMYQTPIFKALNDYISDHGLLLQVSVYFGDDLSLKEVYFEETKTTFKPDTPFLLDGYSYEFLKNYSRDARKGFLSRINPSIFKKLKEGGQEAILIHGYESLTAWLALFSAKLLGRKVLWRGESVLRGTENRHSFKNIVKRLLLRTYFKNCDAVLYSCQGNKEYLLHYGVREETMLPIPCAVNNDFFLQEKERYGDRVDEVREELEIPSDHLILLFSARFTPRKRPLDLLKALEKIDHSKISVLFVGDGPSRQEMEDFCQQKKIHAVFTGFKNQSEISRYYSVADIDLVISDYDPSPKAMNEAMLFELPIIVTDVVGTAHDLVVDGENGFVIEVGAIDALAEKIDFLNKNRDQIPVMGRKSLEIVKEWNFEADVKGIIDAFHAVT